MDVRQKWRDFKAWYVALDPATVVSLWIGGVGAFIALAALAVAAATLVLQLRSQDSERAIVQLAELAKASKRQTRALNNQVRVVRRQAREASVQTQLLARQLGLAGDQLEIARKDQVTNSQTMLAARAGDVQLLLSKNPDLNAAIPEAIVTVRNVGRSTISRASVAVRMHLVDIDRPEEVFTLLSRPRVQTIPLGDEELQHIFEPGLFRTRLERAAFERGEKAVAVAIRVSWFDRGDPVAQVRSRCWMFAGQFEGPSIVACPDLDEIAAEQGKRR